MTFKSFFFSFCVMGFAFSAGANFYQVENVSVRAQGESAKQAKTTAMEQAQVQAFDRLMKRLLGKDNSLGRKQPDEKEIISMVQDMSIQNEKNTATEYWATVNVGFNEKGIKEFLQKNEIDFLTQEPQKLLVIPVYQKGEKVLGTLDEENPVFQFLRTQETLSDFYPLVLPDGDIDEVVLVNKSLANNHKENLNELLGRYGAKGILLLKAEDVGGEHWRLTGEIYLSNQLNQKQEAFDWYQGYSLSQAWEVLLNHLEEEWRLNQTKPEQNLYYARLTEPTIQAWVQDKKSLEKLSFLKDILVRGISHNQMLISYTYEGNPDDLAENWEKAGWEWQADFTGPSGSLKRKDVYYE